MDFVCGIFFIQRAGETFSGAGGRNEKGTAAAAAVRSLEFVFMPEKIFIYRQVFPGARCWRARTLRLQGE